MGLSGVSTRYGSVRRVCPGWACLKPRSSRTGLQYREGGLSSERAFVGLLPAHTRRSNRSDFKFTSTGCFVPMRLSIRSLDIDKSVPKCVGHPVTKIPGSSRFGARHISLLTGIVCGRSSDRSSYLASNRKKTCPAMWACAVR